MPEQFTCPFCYVPDELTLSAKELVVSYLDGKEEWRDEIEQGKMFGVLIVKSAAGEVGFLAAFSGNLAGTNYHDFFVPPIFDFQERNGVYKKEEAEIEQLGEDIAELAHSPEVTSLRAEIEEQKRSFDTELAARKAELKRKKRLRDERRKMDVSFLDEAALVNESQFEKAELKRFERRCKALIAAKEQALAQKYDRLAALKGLRQHKSQRLQRWLFARFKVRNALGSECSMNDIFRQTACKVPPSGAGECCAPKLLQYAYTHGFVPISMGEFWYGKSPKGEVRHHLAFYPACHAKCEPILGFMLQGLDVMPDAERAKEVGEMAVLYEDEWLIVVDKPSGLCSVPGRETSDSCIGRLRRELVGDDFLEVVHRLDMSTSGLLVVARDATTLRLMHQMFASRRVSKRYVAVLDGIVRQKEGVISLPLRANVDDRPRQMVDCEHGHKASTRFEVLGYEDGRTRVAFYPLTGRTHQLRVHAAHPEGLGVPIVGDNLYGTPSDRLLLHAERIEFIHPHTHKLMIFTSKAAF